MFIQRLWTFISPMDNFLKTLRHIQKDNPHENISPLFYTQKMNNKHHKNTWCYNTLWFTHSCTGHYLQDYVVFCDTSTAALAVCVFRVCWCSVVCAQWRSGVCLVCAWARAACCGWNMTAWRCYSDEQLLFLHLPHHHPYKQTNI